MKMTMKRIYITIILALSALSTFAAPRQSYYFDRAEKAYAREDYETCLRYLEKGVQEDPKDGLCWAVMAEIYSKRAYARYAEALQAAEQAMRYLKKDDYWMGFLYQIRGDVYYKIDELELSEQNYIKALQYGQEIEYYASLCEVLVELEKYQDALSYYHQALELHPDYIYLNAEIANLYLTVGDTVNAERYANMCHYLSDGENILSYQVLSNIALARHQVPLACQRMAQGLYLAVMKDNGIDFDTLYHYYPDLLEAAIQNEMEVHHYDNEALQVACRYYVTVRKLADALYYLHRIAKLADDEQLFSSSFASLYNSMGEYEKSLEYAQQALQLDSTDADAYYSLSQTYMLMRDHEQSILALEKMIDLNGNRSVAYRMIGRNYVLMGDYEQALSYMEKAILVTDEYSLPTCVFNKGEVLRLMGRDQEAEQEFRMAEELVDNDRTTRYYISAFLGEREVIDHYCDSIVHSGALREDYSELVTLYGILHDKQQVLHMMDLAIENGYRDDHLFLSNIRLLWLQEDADFLALIERMRQVRQADMTRLQARLNDGAEISGTTEIPFSRVGGVCQVKCSINDLPLYFVFDTGASDVTISSVEANFMLKNGYLTEADFMGKQNYITATGDIHEGTIVNLREVRVGELVLRDVKASVVGGQHAPLLLGQTVFRRFGTIQVDNENRTIRMIK